MVVKGQAQHLIEDAMDKMQSLLKIDGKVHTNINRMKSIVPRLIANSEAFKKGAKYVRLPAAA